ncbi:MAG: tetratricopeptide repeat-containing glycosyltransferase family protein [Planctomycetaceae bacterium]
MNDTASTLELNDWVRHGCQLQNQGRWQEAQVCFEEAVRIAPQELQTLIQLGFVLIQLKNWRRAAEIYERIVPLLPRDHRVWCNLSYLHERCGQFLPATDRARKAIRLAPESGESWNNLGLALRCQHHLSEAIQAFRQALIRQPAFALAEFNLAATHLLRGEYELGWPGYEARNRLAEARLRTPLAPQWLGEPLPTGKLLVYSDQGLGDLLQFLRFLPEARRISQAATLVLSSPGELTRLLEGCAGVDQIVTLQQEPADCTAELAISSLPGLLGVTQKAIAGPVPYLKPVVPPLLPPVADLLKQASRSTLRVGLVWRGNPAQANDYQRSLFLEQLEPLASIPGVSWFSLQVGDAGREQLSDAAARWNLADLGQHFQDFSDTVAALEHLELLITVDTATAHLAGALGRPVWTLLCHTPDWRWGLNGTRSVWYPCMRLFRQPAWGDWESVVRSIQTAMPIFRDIPRPGH